MGIVIYDQKVNTIYIPEIINKGPNNGLFLPLTASLPHLFPYQHQRMEVETRTGWVEETQKVMNGITFTYIWAEKTNKLR